MCDLGAFFCPIKLSHTHTKFSTKKASIKRRIVNPSTTKMEMSALTPEIAAVGMTLSPAIGVAIIVALHSMSSTPVSRNRLIGICQTVSITLIVMTALLLLQEVYHREGTDEMTPYVFLSFGVMMGIFVHHLLEQLGSGAGLMVTTSIFIHSVLEGAAVGVSAGSSNFDAIAWSIILHNVPEGIAIAAVCYPKESGVLKTIWFALMSHLGQGVAVVYVARYGLASTPASEVEAWWTEHAWLLLIEGVSVGTIAASIVLEMVPTAVEEIGWKMTVIATGTMLALGIAVAFQ